MIYIAVGHESSWVISGSGGCECHESRQAIRGLDALQPFELERGLVVERLCGVGTDVVEDVCALALSG